MSDDAGFMMQLHEISLGDAGIRWGHYTNPAARWITGGSSPEKMVVHCQLSGTDVSADNFTLREKQFVAYRETAADLYLSPTPRGGRTFFELMLDDSFLCQLSTSDSRFLQAFAQQQQPNTYHDAFRASMTPEMLTVIYALQQAPYSGSMRSLYLESKLMELFLMQLHQLDNTPVVSLKLKTADVDRLHEVRHYLEQHFSEELSLQQLAKTAGINQTQLKSGFKSLFGTTVFGHLHELRLQEARRLLQEGKWHVNEVAYTVGYKYPHHFTAAFKKRFGILPRCIKG